MYTQKGICPLNPRKNTIKSFPRSVTGNLPRFRRYQTKIIPELVSGSSTHAVSCYQRGFTLIELLVVVLIIGILAAVALPQYQQAVDKSRMTQALTWAKSIRDVEQIYQLANDSYTQKLEDLDISFAGCTETGENSHYYACNDGWIVSLHTGFSVYVHLPSAWTPASSSAGIEYYFSGLRLCYATSDRFKKVCKSMGGTPHETDTNYFVLP